MAKTWWNTKTYNPLFMIPSNKCVAGYHMSYMDKDPARIIEACEAILALYKEGKVKPRIDSVWAFEDVSILLYCSNNIYVTYLTYDYLNFR